MVLEKGDILIEDIVFGPEGGVKGHCLVLDQKSLKQYLLKRDERLLTAEISLARPGESVRIICVKDVVEPWCKVSGDKTGEGRHHILKNIAVVTCGKIVGFQEGIIDMSGSGALYSPFSKTLNVVIDITVGADIPPHEHEEAAREAGLAAAQFIGETCRDATPDTITRFPPVEPETISADLPKIVYVYMLLSQGLLHDTIVFGQDAKQGLPCIMKPQVLMDGGIVSANCVSACDKNTTYHHQNNPVIHELNTRHGKDLNFIGVVLTNELVRLAGKEASAAKSIELVKELNPDGVLLSKEGFGNPDADQMMIIRGLEKAGIKTVAITDEYAGADGCSQSLADVTPEADAMISVGNANERIVLPPMDRILGPVEDLSSLAGAYPQSLRDDGSLEIELQGIIGSTNELGFQRLRCREV